MLDVVSLKSELEEIISTIHLLYEIHKSAGYVLDKLAKCKVTKKNVNVRMIRRARQV